MRSRLITLFQNPAFTFAAGKLVLHAIAVWAALGIPQMAVAQFLGQDFLTGNADGATATNTTDMAVGRNAVATGGYSIGVGDSATSTGSGSTAIGNESAAIASYSTALGFGATATGISSTASGYNGLADGGNSSAYGQYSMASALDSTAIGQGSVASGVGGTATGQNSTASGADSTAVGANSRASGSFSSAFGQGATATFANSTAIGYGAATARANQMMFGTASNTYTAPGITSAASLAAQSGPTQFVTSDAGGNLATASANNIVAGSAAFQGLQSEVNSLQQQSFQNSEGVAMAIALGAAPPMRDDSDRAITVKWGTFGGQNALGISGAQRLGERLIFSGGVGAGCNQGTVGGGGGLTYSF